MLDVLRDPIWQFVGAVIAFLALLLAAYVDRDKIRIVVPTKLSPLAAFLLGTSVAAMILVGIGVALRVLFVSPTALSLPPTSTPLAIGTSISLSTVLPSPAKVTQVATTSLSTGEPPPTRTKTPTATSYSPTPPSGSPAPTLARTPLKPSTEIGTLSVSAMEGCSVPFDLMSGNQQIGSGRIGTPLLIATGTYDVVAKNDFGNPLTRKGVVVRAQETTAVDLTQELGVLQLAKPIQLKQTIVYKTLSGNQPSGSIKNLGSQYCGSRGVYTLSIEEGESFSSSSVFTPWIVSSRFERYALFSSGEAVFDVEIKGGEITIVRQETWSKQIGLVSFTTKRSASLDISTTIYNLQISGKGNSFTLSSSKSYWMLAGRYKIAITSPYVGLTFDNVEIKGGEETILELPD